ncbi:MAG: hypothetical protein E7582_01625 [Ruminococcaceae bacterium]|nr:hypothetical protein [Oscillospiraceae bacterium]
MNLIEKTIKREGIEKNLRLLHVTDAHLVLWDERDDKKIIQGGAHKGKRVSDWAAARYERFTIDSVPSCEKFATLCDWIRDNAKDFDAVFFTGDILDFYTDKAVEFLEEQLAKLPIPYIYTPGNHDFIFSCTPVEVVRQRFEKICGGSTYLQKLKVGDVAIIGLDDTRNFYEEQTLVYLKEALKGEKHVILTQHVPLSTKELHEEYINGRHGRDLSLGGEGICLNDSWKTVLDLINAPDSPVFAMICGDKHNDHLSILEGEGGVPEYISPLCAENPPVVFNIVK